ncbi:hypothetical protein HDU77_011719 [Chytriomyces hyalinus]|nr:hypothetical protein HDU77_011719 [Chytriomyces hyalinus]
MRNLSLVAAHARLGLRRDPQQIAALESLETLGKHLLQNSSSSNTANETTKNSRYIVGSVGSGKSLVMDQFHAAINKAQPGISRRTHFLQFMAETHQQLHRIRSQNPSQDAFRTLAINILNKHPVLCLDEFQIVDIGEAMIMRRLFENLFSIARPNAPKVSAFSLITTSNKPIHLLYRAGLNRGTVKPLLQLLDTHCETLSIQGETDYRTLTHETEESRCLFYPRSSESGCDSPFADAGQAREAFQERFVKACGGVDVARPLQVKLPPGNRSVDVALAVEGKCAMIPFETLCGNTGKLGGADYVTLCSEYKQIFVSGPVPLLDKDGVGHSGVKGVDLGRRFINFVDVAYDSGVRLVIEAAGNPERLLNGLRDSPMPGTGSGSGTGTETRVVKEGGASSSGSTTYIGMMEWSATGLQDASLASIGSVGASETSFAVSRAVSRLKEMGSIAWLRKMNAAGL